MPEQGIPPNKRDLEIKDAQIIFNTVWDILLEELGEENLRFPKELILLGGAPGSGKGTQTRFIMQARGLTCDPIVVSDLLTSPEMRKIKDEGRLVGDREVVELVFRELLRPVYRDGAILDGFPRTKVQVECVRQLTSRMSDLWGRFHGTPLAFHFRKPTVHVVILFVEEHVSIERQLKRGLEIQEHNRKALASGVGQVMELRETDLNEAAARKRYQIFKEQTWDALKSLKEQFWYHFINAQGAIADVERNILRELQYQSSLELDPVTYSAMRAIPLAENIIVHARQELVNRLDGYAMAQPELFHKVIAFINEKMMPIVVRHAIIGMAIINTETPLLHNPDAIAMLIDICSERGFHAVVDIHRIEIPSRFDLNTGMISTREKKVYRIQVRFKGSPIRRG